MALDNNLTIGQKLGVSPWILIDQETINRFGEVTKDPDPQHVDPEWCRQNSPWGTTIAFGFQTLSMLSHMMSSVVEHDSRRIDFHALNYGLEHVRFLTPVKAGSKIRGHFTLKDIDRRKPGQTKIVYHVEVEIEGEDKLALVADWLALAVDREGLDGIRDNASIS